MNPLLRWGLVFLRCPVGFTDEQKVRLVKVAARAYFDDEGEVDFEWPMFRGRVRAISEAVALESFVGQRFQAEVHLPEGSHVVEFLVTEAQLRAAGAEVAEA